MRRSSAITGLRSLCGRGSELRYHSTILNIIADCISGSKLSSSSSYRWINYTVLLFMQPSRRTCVHQYISANRSLLGAICSKSFLPWCVRFIHHFFSVCVDSIHVHTNRANNVFKLVTREENGFVCCVVVACGQQRRRRPDYQQILNEITYSFAFSNTKVL